VLLVNALTFVVSLISLVAVRRPASGVEKVAAGLPGLRAAASDIREGIRYLLSVRVLVVMTAMQLIVNLGLSVEKLLYYFARENLGLSAGMVGLVVAAGGAGGVLGALCATRLTKWIGEMRLIVIAITVCGLAIAAVSVASSFIALALANLVYLWALVVANLINRTQRQRIVPRELLGRVTGTVRVLFLAGYPIGVVITGSVTAALGGDPRLVFAGAGALVIGAAIWGWFAGLRAHDRAGRHHVVTARR
jgi:predicted MFS family arabinose efflux permease